MRTNVTLTDSADDAAFNVCGSREPGFLSLRNLWFAVPRHSMRIVIDVAGEDML
jgi:hypothetical protein